jgi:hypothetical protein
MASSPIVRPVPIYVNQNKVGDATEGSYEVDGGREMHVTDAGVAFSRGRVTCKMDITTIVPVKGMRVRLMELLIAQKDVSVQLPVDGKLHAFDGVITTGGYNWNHAKGACTGKFSFLGATPDVS